MNATAKFNLVVAGELVPGASPEAVKNNLAKLFKLPVEKAEVLLNATPRTLQKEVDQATAMKWRAALQRAGLKSSIQPVATKVEIGRASCRERGKSWEEGGHGT